MNLRQTPRAAGDASAKTEPLDPDGKPTGDGRIVLLSIGMSNTTMEFSRFKEIADKDPAKSPKLTIVDVLKAAKTRRHGTRPPSHRRGPSPPIGLKPRASRQSRCRRSGSNRP